MFQTSIYQSNLNLPKTCSSCVILTKKEIISSSIYFRRSPHMSRTSQLIDWISPVGQLSENRPPKNRQHTGPLPYKYYKKYAAILYTRNTHNKLDLCHIWNLLKNTPDFNTLTFNFLFLVFLNIELIACNILLNFILDEVVSTLNCQCEIDMNLRLV